MQEMDRRVWPLGQLLDLLSYLVKGGIGVVRVWLEMIAFQLGLRVEGGNWV
jgi:hypothetical protein